MMTALCEPITGNASVSRQLTLDDALAARDTALARVARNAGEEFMERALAFVPDYLRRNGPSSGEDITDAAKAAGIVPPNGDRSFGAVYASLSRAGTIAKDGYCARRKGNATAGGITWRIA